MRLSLSRFHYPNVFLQLMCFAVMMFWGQSNHAMCQSNGAFRAIIVDIHGKPIEGAAALLTTIPATKAEFHAESSKDGMLRMGDLPGGPYLLIVTARGLPQRPLGITIVEGEEQRVGRIIVGYIDCFVPGVYCDSYGAPVVNSLPCLKNVDLVQDMAGSLIYQGFGALTQRAVRKVYPKLPQYLPLGYQITVGIMIGKSGKVLCAGLDGELMEGISVDAVLAAAKGWRFKPILGDDGQAVAALGRLLFTATARSDK